MICEWFEFATNRNAESIQPFIESILEWFLSINSKQQKKEIKQIKRKKNNKKQAEKFIDSTRKSENIAITVQYEKKNKNTKCCVWKSECVYMCEFLYFDLFINSTEMRKKLHFAN